MRTTGAIDDELLAKAKALTGVSETADLAREGLRALIERESARRLARLGAREPDLAAPPRRRPGFAARWPEAEKKVRACRNAPTPSVMGSEAAS